MVTLNVNLMFYQMLFWKQDANIFMSISWDFEIIFRGQTGHPVNSCNGNNWKTEIFNVERFNSSILSKKKFNFLFLDIFVFYYYYYYIIVCSLLMSTWEKIICYLHFKQRFAAKWRVVLSKYFFDMQRHH